MALQWDVMGPLAPMSILYRSISDDGVAADPGGADAIANWLRIVAAEYREIPGLLLTKPQVQRLWNLDANTSTGVLDALETAGFLRRTRTGGYIRTGS